MSRGWGAAIVLMFAELYKLDDVSLAACSSRCKGDLIAVELAHRGKVSLRSKSGQRRSRSGGVTRRWGADAADADYDDGEWETARRDYLGDGLIDVRDLPV